MEYSCSGMPHRYCDCLSIAMETCCWFIIIKGGEPYVKYYLGKYMHIKFKKNVKKLTVSLNSRVIGYLNLFLLICIFNYFSTIS